MKQKRQYGKSNICAVIVSFNPDNILLKNVKSLIQQVDTCIIVDNGSKQTRWINECIATFHVECYRLESNMGIAYALNEGLKYCIDNDFKLMLTMDQDTVLDENAVKELLKCMNKTNAASVGINWDNRVTKDQETNYLITSGNLVRVNAANKIGGFNNILFIDSVDFDFSLRLIDAGYKLIKVAGAIAIHNLGEAQNGTGYITHSTERYFYIYRNHFYLCKKFWKKHPVFILKKNVAILLDLLSIIVYDKEKNDKIKQIKRGWKEYKKMSMNIANNHFIKEDG